MLQVKTKFNNSGGRYIARGTSCENLKSLSGTGSYQDKKSYQERTVGENNNYKCISQTNEKRLN